MNPRGRSYHPVRFLGHPWDPSTLCCRTRWPPNYYILIGMMLQNAHQHQTPRLFLLAHSSMIGKMHISTIPRGYFSSSTRYVLRFYYQFSPHSWSRLAWTSFSNMVFTPVANFEIFLFCQNPHCLFRLDNSFLKYWVWIDRARFWPRWPSSNIFGWLKWIGEFLSAMIGEHIRIQLILIPLQTISNGRTSSISTAVRRPSLTSLSLL